MCAMITCPNCGFNNENEHTTCWQCKAPLRGQSQGKRVKGTRDIERALRNEKIKCMHGLFRVHPCEPCGRGQEEAAQYQHSTEQYGMDVLLAAGVTTDRTQALQLIRVILAQNKPA